MCTLFITKYCFGLTGKHHSQNGFSYFLFMAFQSNINILLIYNIDGNGFKYAREFIFFNDLTESLLDRLLAIRLFSISSRVLPCVSGTILNVKTRAMVQMMENIKNAVCVPNALLTSINVLVTTNVQVQLKAVTIDAAVPLTFAGNISPIMSHGTGPAPMAKPKMKMTNAGSGTQP